ncbi:helix-hairpin-helix domain-containing protein [Synergistaceae bacterium OttesenSCG-928-I11]|nr:helix-hairpin-helix domain-containing protein [Synergistaceae bacterium OttesenSCG-928-I11]
MLHRDPRRWLFLAGGVCCFIIALGIVFTFRGKFGSDTKPVRTASVLPEFAVAQNTADSESMWVVYVTGAVMSPGVYEIPEGSRVNDAVKRAGGFSIHANPDGINLAARLNDGTHIRVPAMGEADKTQTVQTPTPMTPSGTVTSTTQQDSGKININTCTEEDLLALPGIGPVLSRSIIDHREKNGPFGDIEEICNVSGIGTKRFEAIREYIVVTGY